MSAQRRTLADRAALVDAQRYVGRERPLALVDRLLSEAQPDPPVLLVHGPAGIGKSALLREIARRAESAGATPRLVDGRALAPVPGELERALEGAANEQRPVVLIDTFERIAAIGAALRERILPTLPERALVVIASRRPFDESWFAGAWGELALALEVEPLAPEEAREMLVRHGIDDRELQATALDWGAGVPLALALAADAVRTAGPGGLAALAAGDDVHAALVRRVAGAEIEGGYPDVAAVAAIAPRVDTALLSDVLPGVDVHAAESWLRSLSVAESFSDSVTLHDIVRRVLRSELRRRDPAHERELRRRCGDHAYERARHGEPGFLVDLAALIESDAIRWGFGAEGGTAVRMDALRAGDLDALAAELARRIDADPGWVDDLRPLLDEHPELAIVARDVRDRPLALSVATSTDAAPAGAERDPVLGAWLAHARATRPGEPTVVWRAALTVEGPTSPVLGMLNVAVVLTLGLPHARCGYLPVTLRRRAAREFLAAVGAVHQPELDIDCAPGRRVECHLLDFGPGGLLRNVRDEVYRELGLAPPRPTAPVGATAEAALAALRAARNVKKLAASPLARGTSDQERAAFVQALLAEAASRAFGDTPHDRRLRAVVERGDLSSEPSHEAAAAALGLSRTTYFRLLGEARARVAAHVAGSSRAD